MIAKDLMRLHMEALFTLDDSGRLLALNLPQGGTAPRFFLGRTEQGNVWAVRHDVAPTPMAALEQLLESEPTAHQSGPSPDDSTRYVELLSPHDPVQRVWSGPTYAFPKAMPNDISVVRVTPNNSSLLTPYLSDWLGDVSSGVPMTAWLEDGVAVSVCCSVRVTQRAHEAGVETHADFRGRGYAARVVAAWAAAVREIDRTPLYSTSWENHRSRVVASRLGLVQYGATLHVT